MTASTFHVEKQEEMVSIEHLPQQTGNLLCRKVNKIDCTEKYKKAALLLLATFIVIGGVILYGRINPCENFQECPGIGLFLLCYLLGMTAATATMERAQNRHSVMGTGVVYQV